MIYRLKKVDPAVSVTGYETTQQDNNLRFSQGEKTGARKAEEITERLQMTCCRSVSKVMFSRGSISFSRTFFCQE